MRTKNSLKNIISVTFFNLLIGILGFIKVRVFVNGLSNDIYSLNQLFYQIFSYITIADIGFGLILNQKLYKAFAKKDKEEVNRIYSTSKKFYFYIGTAMFIIALLISFFVQFLTKANVSSWYIQLIFIIFIIRNIVDYYFIAPRYIIDADQKNYQINHLIKGIKVIETIIEIILVLCHVNYLIILLPGIFLTIIIDIYVNKKIKNLYPWLKNNNSFNKKYLKGTKDLIYQKVSGLLNSNTDIILISTFINPLSVIIYTSYSYITKFVTDTVYIVASAITPSYANVICKETPQKSYEVFKELNILFLFIASLITIMFILFLNPLIELWVGEEYLTGKLTLILFCIIAFQNIAMKAIMITINSQGLFKETKIATIIEAVLNLIISVIGVHKLGLIGVLLGTIISYFASSFIQNARYIYKNIFKESSWKYFINYILVVLITVILTILMSQIKINITSILSWIIYAIIFGTSILLILFITFYFAFKPFKNLAYRGIEFIKVKGKFTE